MPFLVAMYTFYSKSICFVTSRSHLRPLKYSNVFTSNYDFFHRTQPSSPNKNFPFLFMFLSQMEDWRLVSLNLSASISKLGNVLNLICVP